MSYWGGIFNQSLFLLIWSFSRFIKFILMKQINRLVFGLVDLSSNFTPIPLQWHVIHVRCSAVLAFFRNYHQYSVICTQPNRKLKKKKSIPIIFFRCRSILESNHQMNNNRMKVFDDECWIQYISYNFFSSPSNREWKIPIRDTDWQYHTTYIVCAC